MKLWLNVILLSFIYFDLNVLQVNGGVIAHSVTWHYSGKSQLAPALDGHRQGSVLIKGVFFPNALPMLLLLSTV